MSEEAKPKKGRLSKKQQAFVEALPLAETRGQAAVMAGYSDKNPDQSAYQAAKAIERAMPEAMNAAGLTNEALIQKHLVPLLIAEKTSLYGTVADGPTRLGALKLAGEWKGVVNTGTVVNVNHNTLHIDVMTKGEDDLRAILRLATGSRPDSGGGESRAV